MLYLALGMTLLLSCGGKEKEGAVGILDAAREKYESGDYAASLLLIDSLRRSHPEAIEERRKALALYQDASEKMAQKEIASLDIQLQQAQKQLDSLQNVADAKRGDNDAATLAQLARQRQKRDSLQVAFDTQCAKVRLIRERRKG